MGADRRSALVTGATGFLGSKLAARLLDSGHDVTAVVRSSSAVGRLPSGVAIVVHDGTTDGLTRTVADAAPDIVFHMATHYVRNHDPSEIDRLVESNILFGAQLLEAMHTAGCSRIVIAGSYFQLSSSGEYRPLNLYAATKQAFEDLAVFYASAGGMRVVSLMLAGVYGPGDWRPKILQRLQDAQQTGIPIRLVSGHTPVDLVFVDDAVMAFVRAGDLMDEPHEAGLRRFSVSSGAPVTIKELLDVFVEVTGSPVPHEWMSTEPISSEVETPWTGSPLPDWHPKVGLADGIATLLERA